MLPLLTALVSGAFAVAVALQYLRKRRPPQLAWAIGRRYRRQDEIGTPLCVTVDFDSLEDRAVTIRDRDSMAQVRVPIAELVPALQERLGA